MAAACSPDCRYYAALSDDGRLRIWSTETNTLLQEYTPDLHLSAPPVCLAWITLGIGTATKKAKKRKSSTSELQPEIPQSNTVALGTKFGKIILYSLTQANVETILEPSKDFKHNSVTCLDWNREFGLYSGSSNNYVYEWDISSSTVKNKYDCNVEIKNTDRISAIKIIPHNLDKDSRLAVTASNKIRIWSLSPLKLLRTMIGHSTAISMIKLARFSDKCLIGTCSKTDRLLSFWDATIAAEDTHLAQNGNSNKHRNKEATIISPAYNFLTEDTVCDFSLSVESGDKIHLGTVTKSGTVHYYRPNLNGLSIKPLKPSVTLHVSTEDAKPLPIQCCSLTGQSDGQMVIGYLSGPSRYCFERVTPSLKNKTQVLIRVGHDTIEEKRKVSESNDKITASTVTYAQPSVAIKRTANYTSKDEVPMESRLANLELGESRNGSVKQNLTKLLVQGLHSNDNLIIMTVLQKTDNNTAAQTVSNLPSKYVPALLEQLSNMAGGRTNLCKAVCVWLSALLRSHSAMLLATLNTPEMADKFSRLLAVLAQRRSHLCQLLNLKGRLELTLAQRTQTESLALDSDAVIDYNDMSSDSGSELEMELGIDESEIGSESEEDASLKEGGASDTENQ